MSELPAAAERAGAPERAAAGEGAAAGVRPASRLIDWSLLILCNLIWASQFVLAKLVQEEMGPIFATLLPMTIATLGLLPLVRRQQQRSRKASGAARQERMSTRDVARFAVIGLFGQVVAQLGITWGVGLAPASNAALLSLTLPIATAVMAYLLLGERMTAVRWISFALAVAGVLQCSGIDWNDLRFASGGVVSGNLLIMLGVLGSAFYNVYGKKLLDRYTPLEVLLYSYYAVLICLVPLTLYLEPGSFHSMFSFGPRVWLGIFLLAGLQYFLSMILFLTVLTRLDAAQAGLSNYLIPVFGVLIAALALGERLTPRMAVGGLVVLGSTLLVTVYEEHYGAKTTHAT
jgi:drug/metabolite transporter (DMT)-like permease